MTARDKQTNGWADVWMDGMIYLILRSPLKGRKEGRKVPTYLTTTAASCSKNKTWGQHLI